MFPGSPSTSTAWVCHLHSYRWQGQMVSEAFMYIRNSLGPQKLFVYVGYIKSASAFNF